MLNSMKFGLSLIGGLFIAAAVAPQAAFAQSVFGTVGPRQVSYIGTLTYTATASGLDPATTRYAYFRRRPGGTWIPSINSPNWTASTSFNWNPTLSDVGVWETYVWAKDGNTPANMNTYGYAAGHNTQPIEVFGPPTVPGPTSASCAWSDSGVCWVTSDFAISVSPSTGGLGSLIYHICRSNDTTGWGGCDVHLTMNGGTSITVSGSHLPSDGYRRVYYFQSRDSAGAYSGWNSPLYVKIDRYAPSVGASNASDIWYSYRTATISASDSHSGLQSVRYSWNAALNSSCTTGTSTSSGATLTVPGGDNLLYVCARDNTGRVAQWNGRYRVAPLTIVSASVSPSRASYLSTFTSTATAAGGTPSSTRFAFFRRRPGGTWIPSVTAPVWQTGNTYTWQPALADVGMWETYIWVKDGDTPPSSNTYGYSAGYNTGMIEVVGKPTIPGPTTVACAYAVGDDCWVQGDFTASVSASTGGMGTLNYHICRSNDTTGWGGCDVHLTFTGGTSILVSGTHLPPDGFRRAYYFQTQDSAGAYSGWNTPRFVRVDRYAPTVSATNASDEWFYSRTATVAASDAHSGVQSVRYSWGAALDANCTTGTATSIGANLTAPTGDNLLYLCAKDNTGRVGQWNGRYRIAQPLGLTGSVSPSRDSYLKPFTYTANASGGIPSSTRFAFFRRRSGTATWIPDVTTPNWQAGNQFVWQPTLADVGFWDTYIWVKDSSTPASQNTYGYAAGANTGQIEVVGKPTIPGATTVTCAYTTVDDCWVQGDFTASVTASTGGMGSLVYQICRSNDTTGFGGCDVNLTLTGGTSILVSSTNLPADNFRRAYYFQAKDTAGALSGWNTPRYVRVDRYAPVASATNASDLWFSARSATVSATDAGSGIQSLRYSWNTALDANCTTGTATTSGTTLAAPAGDNLLYLCAKDNTGRVGQWNGRYRVAPLSVTGTVNPTRGSYRNPFTFTATASGGTPATIRYAFFRRRSGTSTWIPDVNAPVWQSSNVFVWQPVLADVGLWDGYVWVKDGDTPATMNTYGYAVGSNLGQFEVVGKPTVPGPTAVTCAYTAGEDCWVQGDFVASVTASTGGMGGLVYEICRSNDSAGGFAGCETNITLSGGTSITVSGTHLPGDGFRRSYWFQARDSAGALSGWNTQKYVRVDRQAPVASATNASDLWFSSRSAVVSASDPAGGSGLQAVRYSWNTALDAGCTSGTATTSGTTLTVPSGDNLLYLCAKDNTGRVAQWNGRYRVSPLGLTGTVTPKRASYVSTFTYTATASNGNPGTIRYAFFRRTGGGDWIPNVSTPNWQVGNTFTWQPTLSDVGNWETYIWVKDGDTPATMNTYGYAAGFNTGPIEVVGKPTVPGPTTVSCAYTSGEDCWVQGDFTASVTASTGGMGTLNYHICRSNDTTGWGGCEVHLTFTGGTSILVSGAHLPGDGFRRSYWFQTQDAEGAYSGWNTPRFVRVDRYAPVISATNASNDWVPDLTATVSAADSSGGTGANSGLVHARYAWNTALDATCTTGTAVTSGTTLTPPFGDNTLYLCARDNVARVTQWSGRYRKGDPLRVTGTVTPKPQSYLGAVTYTATANGGDPNTRRFAFFRRKPGQDWIPDIHQPNWQQEHQFTWNPTFEDVGVWETYIWVKDGDTPPDMNIYGYAAGFNTMPIEIVGKPTVPGPTTVSCGWTTAEDCWVKSDFTASVDPSTGGLGNLVYQICRSNDSAGGFAGCEANLTLTGGASVMVTEAHLPGDGFRRSFWFQAKDTAGALSGWNTPRYVRVDRYPPSISATNASEDWFESRTATVSAADDDESAAFNSGLVEARYSWNTETDAACTTGTVVATGTTLDAPDGDNMLYLCARDNVGWVAQWSGRYRVGEAPDFMVDLAPAAATVVKGGSAQFTIALSTVATFTDLATLTVSGLPAGSSHTLDPTAIGVGDEAVLTVATTTNTPQGDYEITVTATADDLTREAVASLTVRPPFAPGAPVIDSISPEIFDGGVVKTITLLGRNFQGATVTVAKEDPDPDHPIDRTFPDLGQAVISADGTRIDIAVDCTGPGIRDFYELVVDNGVGKDASRPFRVIPVGPVVDLVTPSKPERGEDNVYVLTLGGYHLRNATVRSDPAGALVIFGVDADETHINGLLRVSNNAPLGPVDLVVTGSGGHETRIEIEIVAPGASVVATQRLGTQRVDPRTLRAIDGSSPTVLFQRFAVRDPETTEDTDKGMRVRTATSMEKLSADSFSFTLYYQFTVNILNFTWTRAFVFDPLTERIGDEVLKNLGLGDKVRMGAFVLSFALSVDLTIEVYLTNNGFTWPRFCIEITTAIQIPGTNGFYEEWSYCRGGDWFSFGGGGIDSLSAIGGPCAKVTPEEGPPVDGMFYAEVEQTACCSQPIEVSGVGYSFAGGFNLTTPNAGSTTPGPTCTCSVSTPPACVLKGEQQVFTAQGTPAGGTYQWRVVEGSNRVSIKSGATSNALTLEGTAASDEADDVQLEVLYTNGTTTCAQLVDLSVVDIVPLEFRASGQADADNDKSNTANNVLAGLPQLGAVTPGNPAGTVGYFKNMQIKAEIVPCDSNLKCKFDFKRTRHGVVAQIAANGTVIPKTPGHCPNGGCDDDAGNTLDEDLLVDPFPGCSIYVLDTPGIRLTNNGACQGGNGVRIVSCFNFDEWLEMDGRRVTPNLPWYASTRLRCNGTNFVLDNGGAGNHIGPGFSPVDCSPASAYSVSPPLASATATPSAKTAMESVALLEDPSMTVRSGAYGALLRKAQRAELKGEERAEVLEALTALAREKENGELESAPLLAIELLGELRAAEAVPVLLDRLLDEFTRIVVSDADQATPAAQALAKIGAPAIGPLLDLAASAGDEAWLQARASLEMMHQPGRLREAVTARLAATREGMEKERLQGVLDIIDR